MTWGNFDRSFLQVKFKVTRYVNEQDQLSFGIAEIRYPHKLYITGCGMKMLFIHQL